MSSARAREREREREIEITRNVCTKRKTANVQYRLDYYELTYAAYSAKSATGIFHPPRHIILGNRVLSRPLHDRCYFFAKRLKEKYKTCTHNTIDTFAVAHVDR